QDRGEGAPARGLKTHVAPQPLGARVHVAAEPFGRDVRPLLDQHDLETGLGQDARGGGAARSAADDDHVGDVVDASLRRHVVELHERVSLYGSRPLLSAHDGGVLSIGKRPIASCTSGRPQNPRQAIVLSSIGTSRKRYTSLERSRSSTIVCSEGPTPR